MEKLEVLRELVRIYNSTDDYVKRGRSSKRLSRRAAADIGYEIYALWQRDRE